MSWHNHKPPFKVAFFGYDRRDELVRKFLHAKRRRRYQVVWLGHLHQYGFVMEALIEEPPDLFVVHPLARLTFPVLLKEGCVMALGPSRKQR